LYAIVRLQPSSRLAKRGGLRGFTLQFLTLLSEFLALPIGFLLGQERSFPSFLGLFAELLQSSHRRCASLAAADILAGTAEQVARQLQTPGNFQGIAHAELADVQPIRRPQSFDVELHGSVFGAIVAEGVSLQIAEMRGHDGATADLVQLIEYSSSQRGSFGRIGAGAQLVKQDQALRVCEPKYRCDPRHMRAERAQRLLEALLVADVCQNLVENRHDTPFGGRNVHTRLGHEA
jgi:hypothetical protein